MRAAMLLPLAALLTLGAARPQQPARELCTTPGHIRSGYCTLVFFDYDSHEVAPSAWPILDTVIGEAADNDGATIVLAGYTDGIFYPEHAQTLSRQTAESVRDYLIQHGVDEKAISVEAYGSANPRVPNRTGKREPGNRRVEIWVNY